LNASPIASFARLGVALSSTGVSIEELGVLNPACARLPDKTLQLYPRMVAPGNISRIGSFQVREGTDGTLAFEQCGFALEPQAPYELREQPGGYGCEDPRVSFIAELDCYVMAYTAFGPRGPEIALATSQDALQWERLGLLHFQESDAPFSDKDAAFFPSVIRSPAGVDSLAFYHRPTVSSAASEAERASNLLHRLARGQREGIAVGYVPLAAAKRDIRELCSVSETHRLTLPQANWGTIKVGAGTPPVRIREGWLSVIHGVDELEHPSGAALLRYCAGIIIHDAARLDRVIFRSPEPLFVPEVPGEIHGTIGHVVFPSGIDVREERVFDIYYGMADYAIGRGRLTLHPAETRAA